MIEPMRTTLLLLLCLIAAAPALAQKAGTTTVKLYFHNEKFNPNAEDCRAGYPVTRTIPKTPAIATATLELFLKGVTEEEKQKEYWSFSPDETEGILKSVNIRNGAAYVNFTNRLLTQMGVASTSCGSGFFARLEMTLKQFPTIKRVYYAVEGNADEFYEWAQVGECPHGRHCRRANFK